MAREPGSKLRKIAMASLVPVFVASSPAAQTRAPSGRDAPPDDSKPLSAAVVRALDAVVSLRAEVPRSARTAETLGTERAGHGVLVDDDGLVLTVGYLIMEARSVEVVEAGGRRLSASIVAYDFDSGFGLVRTALPLRAKALSLGDSAALKFRDVVTVAGHGGPGAAQRAIVTDRRDFAGYWEYLLENAVFTSPPYGSFGGAALIGEDGALLGIGSLFVGDAYRAHGGVLPGNMFIPVEKLKPILETLKRGERAGASRPWLGVYTQQMPGRLAVAYVAPDSPAERAGLTRGDLIRRVDGVDVDEIAEFYRKLWSLGPGGTSVTLGVERDGIVVDVVVRSVDRYRYLKLDGSL